MTSPSLPEAAGHAWPRAASRSRRLGPLADIWTVFALARADSRHRDERPRIPEPAMAITDPAAVRRFSEGAASQPLMRSVYDFSARSLGALVPDGGRVLDLGVGSGHALAFFLLRRPDVTAVGVDLSPAMLATAQFTFEQCGLADRVTLVRGDISALPPAVTDEPVNAVSSLWTLHQLPDPGVLGASLRQLAALRDQHGAAIWVVDFERLGDARSLPRLISALEPEYPGPLRADAIASEAAAFRPDELRTHFAAAGLHGMRQRSAWPLRYLQVAWAPALGAPANEASCWHEIPLEAATRQKAALLRVTFGTSIRRPLPRGK